MLVYEKKRDVLIVRLAGDLDDRTAGELRREIDALISDIGVRRLLFDMRELRFMDSSGIGLIIGRYKRMRGRGGSVAVYGLDERMDKIFSMAGLYRLVERLA